VVVRKNYEEMKPSDLLRYIVKGEISLASFMGAGDNNSEARIDTIRAWREELNRAYIAIEKYLRPNNDEIYDPYDDIAV
jgi:hypothetical protein